MSIPLIKRKPRLTASVQFIRNEVLYLNENTIVTLASTLMSPVAMVVS